MADMKEQHIEAQWQSSVPNIALGTILLALSIGLGYYLIITHALQGNVSYFWASLICTYLAYASFTVVHDAGHGSIIKSGSQIKPFESILGWVFSLPLVILPYRFFQKIHDRHHAFTNDPDRDPDHYKFSNSPLLLILNCLYIPIQYQVLTFTKLKHVKVLQKTYLSTLIYFGITFSSITLLTYAGFGAEVLYFIVIPNILGTICLTLLFDYLPHHPHKSRDRYHDSRIYPGRLLNVLLLGQNYHLIHHMFPRIPWYKYAQVYQRVLPELEANNAPIEDVFWGTKPRFLKSPSGNSLLNNGNNINMVLPVLSVTLLTHNSVEVVFKLPSDQRLKYKAGQYVTVSKWLNGEQQTRCYSLCSAPHQGELCIGVHKTKDGLFSTFINHQLAPGDELIVQGPFGDFVYPPKEHHFIEHLVLIAGGSGITPILSIIESALVQDKAVTIDLIYACSNNKRIMFHEKIEELKELNPHRLTVHYAIGQQETKPRDNSGKLSESTLKSLQPRLFVHNFKESELNTDIYICGPEGLKNMILEVFEQSNVAQSRIHVEQFTSSIKEPLGKLHSVNVQLAHGENHTLAVASNQSVLEVALANGINLPHACTSGTCGSCKMNIVKGKAKAISDNTPGITIEEKLAGMTLTCQCMPLENLTIIEE